MEADTREGRTAMVDFDIYRNRIPTGLLTPEERAALEAHDGAYEMFRPDGTTAYLGKRDFLSSDIVYRAIKPQPRPLTVKPAFWEAFPTVQYVARDEDGRIWAFTVDIETVDNVWVMGSRGNLMHIGLLCTFLDPGTCDWREAIAKRPEGV